MSANNLTVITQHPLIDDVLATWQSALGGDGAAYRGHVYRMVNITRALSKQDRISDALALAAAFHDLGIWSDATFDYLPPSLQRAAHWVEAHALPVDGEHVANMIALHHKLTPCPAELGLEVEHFRRADLADVSLGLLRFGLPYRYMRELVQAFPRAGFHRCLARAGWRWLMRNPARPLPMLRW